MTLINHQTSPFTSMAARHAQGRMTLSEIGEALGASQKLAINLYNRGLLPKPSDTAGDRKLWRKSDINEFVKKYKTEENPATIYQGGLDLALAKRFLLTKPTNQPPITMAGLADKDAQKDSDSIYPYRVQIHGDW